MTNAQQINKFYYQKFFQKIYVPFICHWIFQWTALLSYIIFGLLAYVGIENLVIGFDVSFFKFPINF